MPDLTLESICHFQCILTRDLNKAKKQRKPIEWERLRDLFKKMRHSKGTFHAKTGTIKERNVMGLTKAEKIKKR